MTKRAWVFVDDETNEEIGEAAPNEYVNADHAVQSFGNEYANDFGVYFRTKNGTLHPCDAESTPKDFK